MTTLPHYGREMVVYGELNLVTSSTEVAQPVALTWCCRAPRPGRVVISYLGSVN